MTVKSRMGAAACRVAVGSTNPVKANAVRRAFRLLCNAVIEKVAVESGVPPQPIGFHEVVLGAFNRACRALEKAGADYGVGVEAGLVDTGVEYIELQAAVVVSKEKRVSIGFSQGFPLPANWVEQVLSRTELGEIAASATRRRGLGERLGVIGYLTSGLVTRTDLTYNAVLMAIVPLLNPHLYTRLPSAKEVRQRLKTSCPTAGNASTQSL